MMTTSGRGGLGKLDRLLAVARLRDHLEPVVQRQRGPDPVPDERVVIGDQDASACGHIPPSPR
jgi:hypothetical protein